MMMISRFSEEETGLEMTNSPLTCIRDRCSLKMDLFTKKIG